MTFSKKNIIILSCLCAVAVAATVAVVSCRRAGDASSDGNPNKKINLLYGIESDPYDINRFRIEAGLTMSQILSPFGISAAMIDHIETVAKPIFPLRNIRAGHPCTAFMCKDSTARLDYFVYEENMVDYIVFDLRGDTAQVLRRQKEVSSKRHTTTATIDGSLWNCMVDNGINPVLAMDMSDIYAWSIDFFGLQKGDKFSVIYDQKYVDTTNVGIGIIWGAWFEHGGKTHYAIPFMQDGKLSYWDENGNSLRKNMLKAPLKYSRISSRFSNARFHPVLRIWRPHHGVDYAAPSGTPIIAVGDGTVTFKGYTRGGGNTIKIQHAQGLVSSYMHLKGYAKNIASGRRVRQGDVIGYVGSTGLSTGPHLDYRVYRGGKPINPLSIPTTPAEPIKAANKEAFSTVRDRVLAELKGGAEAPDSVKITSVAELQSQ